VGFGAFCSNLTNSFEGFSFEGCDAKGAACLLQIGAACLRSFLTGNAGMALCCHLPA